MFDQFHHQRRLDKVVVGVAWIFGHFVREHSARVNVEDVRASGHLRKRIGLNAGKIAALKFFVQDLTTCWVDPLTDDGKGWSNPMIVVRVLDSTMVRVMARSLGLKCRNGRRAAVGNRPSGIRFDPAKREEMHMGNVKVRVRSLMGSKLCQDLIWLVWQEQLGHIHRPLLQNLRDGPTPQAMANLINV